MSDTADAGDRITVYPTAFPNGAAGGTPPGGPLPFKTTVALLPLENISKNKEMDWLSEGIPESMIAKLQNLSLIHI